MKDMEPVDSSVDFLGGGGEMGALIRAHDWAGSSLGPAPHWPQGIRTAIRLVLNTRHPMYIFWGTELLCFYNDAYRASIGPERHPRSLGQPAREVWGEIWDVIGPQIDQVMSGHGATWHENQLLPITRNGRREQVYWTYSYGPIDEPGAPNGIGGVLVVCSETTATVLAEQRRLQEAERQRHLFDQAPSFIIVMRGPDHTVEFVNQAHRQLFGSQGWLNQDMRQASPDIAAQGFIELLDGVYATGTTYRAHGAAVRFKRRPDAAAETRILDFVYSPIFGAEDDIEGVFCEGLDATDRIQAQAALRESEARFGEVANAAPVMIWMSDAARRHTWFNTLWLSFTGRTMESSQGDGWLLDVHPDDVDKRLKDYQNAFERRERFRVDYRLRRRDGTWRTVEDGGVPRFSDDGVFLGYAGCAVDVTDQRETETALRRSEEQLRLATDAAEVGLWDVDTVRDELFWPPRVKAMFGISADVPVSMADFYAGLHPDDAARVSEAYATAVDPARRAVYAVEFRTVGREDGVVRWIAAKGRGVFDEQGRCVRMIGTAIDVSERKFDEERLRQSEARLAEAVATLDALLASAPLGFAFFDKRLRYVRVNAVLADINQASTDAHLGRTIDELAPADSTMLAPILRGVIDSGQAVASIEIDTHATGSPHEGRSWLAGFFPVRGAQGDAAYVGMTLVDITHRRWAEAALRRVNDNLEAQVAERTAERDRVWRNSRDLLVVVDAEGFFLAVSPSWTAILGHKPEQVVGRHYEAFVWRDDAHATSLALASAVAADDLNNFENRYRHVDGTPRWISWRTSMERGIVYAYGRDVTSDKAREAELERVEDALRQSQKMEAIGQLTGGIAHDFNNLLQGLAGSLELIKRRSQDASLVLKWAESGLLAVSRGAKLTGQLLAFSRSQKLKLEPLDAAQLLPKMRELLSRTLGPAIRIEIVVAEPSIVVFGDETQLEMAVLNLAINARDAMPDGGTLGISLVRRQLRGDSELLDGDYAELTVADSGAGMPSEVIARAFDPFFTTKGVGKGTGLGLSQVYGMTRQAGGVTRIDSDVGVGTAVHVFLPCTRESVAPSTPAGATGQADSARQATILVVDDDDDVRSFLIDSLESLGYETVAAVDGQAAIDAYLLRPPDAMVIDFAMPGLNGAEVATRLRAIEPRLPIVFASGFSETAAIESLPGPHAPTLRKPFGIAELGDALAGVIAARTLSSRAASSP